MGACIGKSVKTEKLKRAEKTLSLNLDNENLTNLHHIEDHPIPNLTVFSANNNNLSSLPKHFFDSLLKIKRLELSKNNFAVIDELIMKQNSLEFIILSRNQIETIPGNLSYLNHLKELDLSHNKILLIDPNLKLTSLTYLNLSCNLLQEIPFSIFLMPKLEELNLRNNSIKALPEERWSDSNVSVLDLSDNKISKLAKGMLLNSRISILNLQNNQIEKSSILKDEGYEAFEKRRKMKKDQGYRRNLDIDFDFCGLD